MTTTTVRRSTDAPPVSSFVAGRWAEPTGDTSPLLDASTGEVVARIATTTPDVAAAADWARQVGGPALRALGFHERALILKRLGAHLMARKDSFYEVSARTGATRPDSAVDVDGGIGVLFTYGSKGRRELPGGNVVLDGPPEPLSRSGGFVGQHVFTARRGVALQINAFNFPVWGMLEKLAPAFLAGVPTVAKPASATAHVTEAVVREIVASGLLPEGSLQMLAGSGRGVLDVLGDQDLVAFTGSASTADALRVHPAVLGGGVRFTSEADSLNFSLLGPDATPGTPEFDLFVRALLAEITSKAGQKCTAIRRALVPRERVGDVVAALEARIAEKVVVGRPGAEGVTMGALVGLDQRAEVRERVAQLRGAARLVLGDPDHVDVVGADHVRGAVQPPLVLVADDPWASVVHEVEAFGPAATLIGYSSLGEAVELAARGRGSLVGSVVSHDADVVREVVLGVAPWHGRVLVLDRDDAKESTGHGSPLPHLAHGGPGRAGDGEELGGIRGVLHHMQRTALQGSPRALGAITGTWVPGAPRTLTETHPFRMSLAELRVGMGVDAGPRTITLDDVDHFADFSGDRFYAHTDEVAAAANPFFTGRVAHGYFLVSMAAGLFVEPNPGPVLANVGLENLRFLTPVSPGDAVRVELTAKRITPRVDAEHGEVVWDARLLNQRDEPVAVYDVLTLVAKTR